MEYQNHYHDPSKTFQGVEIPPEEKNLADFMRWWKKQCAQWDEKPKQIIQRDPNRWSATKGGKRK